MVFLLEATDSYIFFSFIGFHRSIKFKDNLRTIKPQFPKNLRTNEAHSDFTGPYKKKCI